MRLMLLIGGGFFRCNLMINEFKKPVVGQIMYRLNINNMARGREQKLTEVKVISVARKYFEAVGYLESYSYFFHIEGGKQKNDSMSNYIIYESPEAWIKEKESDFITKKISNCFRYGGYNFSYDQLKKVSAILFPEGLDYEE